MKLLTPLQKFIKIESFSGILLFGVTLLALLWANSPFRDSYESLWAYQMGLGTDDYQLTKPLILWINDGLMAIFFFLIGLEIKREILVGELNSLRKAALPIFAAIGGMFVPILVYVSMNSQPETAGGWAIPMATDIAFTLAILKILGNRIPTSLKIFLTAFAIVDDLGAVMTIAIFYTAKLDLILLSYGMVMVGGLAVLTYFNRFSIFVTVGVGLVVWVCFLKAGIHPTIAGVLLALTVPISRKVQVKEFSDRLSDLSRNLAASTSANPNAKLLTKEQIGLIDEVEDWSGKVQSPLQHLEHSLHSWVAYAIMPIFALANAGIAFGGGAAINNSLVLQIAVCLVVGNAIGISALSRLGLALGLAELPKGVTFRHVIGIACLAGVGFTMSIFVANLAFVGQPDLLDSAKLGILIGSLISGLLGYLILRTAPSSEEVEEGELVIGTAA
ncbi:MAG: Na+/H+ antiporter NhaA [Bacteroidota bacterium]